MRARKIMKEFLGLRKILIFYEILIVLLEFFYAFPNEILRPCPKHAISCDIWKIFIFIQNAAKLCQSKGRTMRTIIVDSNKGDSAQIWKKSNFSKSFPPMVVIFYY